MRGQPGAMRITYPASFVVLAALPADWHDTFFGKPEIHAIKLLSGHSTPLFVPTVPALPEDENSIAVSKFWENTELSRKPPILLDVSGGCGFL